jgi:hypothetical protein
MNILTVRLVVSVVLIILFFSNFQIFIIHEVTQKIFGSPCESSNECLDYIGLYCIRGKCA